MNCYKNFNLLETFKSLLLWLPLTCVGLNLPKLKHSIFGFCFSFYVKNHKRNIQEKKKKNFQGLRFERKYWKEAQFSFCFTSIFNKTQEFWFCINNRSGYCGEHSDKHFISHCLIAYLFWQFWTVCRNGLKDFCIHFKFGRKTPPVV